MLNIILFGPPGSGKGTQALKLIELMHLKHVSTGEILRKAIAAKTGLGIIAASFMDKGNLVPDEIVIKIIQQKIKRNHHVKGFIFDGFPRSISQAEAFDKMLQIENKSISALIALDVEHHELVKRLLERGKESGRADDQDISIIENRVKVYENTTLPVIDYYKAQGKLKKIDGMGTIDDIFKRIVDVIEQLEK
jgi:adenylate kinase